MNMNGGVSMWNALCHFVHDKSMNDSLGMRTNIFSLYTYSFGGVCYGLTENHHTYMRCDRIDVHTQIHTHMSAVCIAHIQHMNESVASYFDITFLLSIPVCIIHIILFIMWSCSCPFAKTSCSSFSIFCNDSPFATECMLVSMLYIECVL